MSCEMSLGMKYFVLKPKSKTKKDPYAEASRLAMLTYANSIDVKNPNLAKNLRTWAFAKDRYHRGMP